MMRGFLISRKKVLQKCVFGLFLLIGITTFQLQKIANDADFESLERNMTRFFISKGPPGENNTIKAANQDEDRFHHLIKAASTRHAVDPALVKAIISVESNFNPSATSTKGAKGLMQLMPDTAVALGVKDSFDPEHNIHGGVKHLRDLLNEFHWDLKLTLAAYNMGSYAVRKYRGIPPFESTKYFVKKVMDCYLLYKTAMPQEGSKT